MSFTENQIDQQHNAVSSPLECEGYGISALEASLEHKTSGSLVHHRWLGLQTFETVRKIQHEMICARTTGKVPDTFLYCEHPPTLSLGKRTLPSEVYLSEPEWGNKGFAVIRANRAGGPTLHMPGQLVVYPVVSLKHGGRSVRQFVCGMLECFVDYLRSYGIQSEAKESPAGVWVSERKKIASVGLRIDRGVTDHGFALNLTGDLDAFRFVAPCGIPGIEMVSVSELSEKQVPGLGAVAQSLSHGISIWWKSGA